MGKLTKEKIVKSMVKKKAYDIKYDFAIEAVKDIDFKKCHKYSIYHYQTIYEIVKSKLNTLSDKNEKNRIFELLVGELYFPFKS